MAFPSSPVNNQMAIVNGIVYSYESSTNTWTRRNTTSANIITVNSANITSNIASVGITSGALKVAGGAGITGNVFAGAVYTNSYFYANGTAFVGGGGSTGYTGSAGVNGYTGSEGAGYTGSAGQGVPVVVHKIARLEETLPNNTAANYLTGGSWGTRRLNTISYDADNIVINLSNYQFTLDPGTYYFSFEAFALKVGIHQVRIQNITNSTTVCRGVTMWSDNTATDVGHRAEGRGRVVITSTTVFALQHYIAVTSTGVWGSGHPAGIGYDEIYSSVEIFKETTGVGYTGSAGLSGALGYTGSKGSDGITGVDGYTGSVGYTGSAGLSGALGYTGSAGVDGTNGSNGSVGYTGSAGEAGPAGNIGYTGSKGADGTIGVDGYTGSAGSAGYTGSAGSAGIGYTGSAGIGYTGSGSGTVSFVAAGTIPTGEVVVLKSDGTVTTAVETTAASFGANTTIATTTDTSVKGVYDPVNQKVVVFYVSSSSGQMIVGTVSGNIISFGTASTFTNGSTPFGFAPVYHPGSGKIVVMFGMSNSTRYSIVTISGTTATASTVTQYLAVTSTVVEGVLNTSSGNIVFVYADLTNSSTKSVVASTNGTTVTFGTEVTVSSGIPSGLNITNDANNNRVVISRYTNASAGTLYVGTVSGTSISFGTGVQYISTGASTTLLSYDPINYQVLLVYSKWSDGTIFYRVGTVSGTSISLGTETSTGLVTRATYSNDFVVSYDSSTSKFALGYRDNNDSGKPKFVFITNNAGSITIGTPFYTSATAGASTLGAIVTANTKVVAGWIDTSSTNLRYAVYVPGTTTVQLNSNNYLGISAGAYQVGNTAIINSAGTVSNVSASSLTIGSVYYVSFADGSLTTTPTSVVAGLAVGTNKILVKQKGDTGYAGSVGTIGYTGSAGSQGAIGYTGSASTVIGYTGSASTVIGYTGSAALNNVAPNAQTASYQLVLSDVGKYINITTGGVTVPSGVFSSGDVISIYNNSGSSQTITQGASVTMYLVGTATTGNRTLAQRGLATVLCVGTNEFVISGGGLA